MSNFAKRFLFSGAALVVVAAIALLCVNLYLQSGGVQQRIREAAARVLGVDVRIGSTSYTPWNGLVLRQLTIPDPYLANLNIVEANALRVRFAFGPLFQRRFVVTECTLFEPRLIVRQLENGDWLVPAPPTRTPEIPLPPGQAAPVPARAATFKAEIRKFHLRGGNLVFLNAKHREVLKLEKTNIEARISDNQSATGSFTIGRMEVSQALKPRKVGGPFTWDGRVLDAPAIEGMLAGGALSGRYRLTAGQDPAFDLGLQLKGVLLKKLAEEAQVDPGKTEGTLEGNLNLTGDPRNSGSIKGKGHFELLSARLKPVEFLSKLGELLQIDELQMLKLNDARLDLTVRDERVIVDDAQLKSENLILRGRGPVRFNGKMNLDAKLLINQKLQQQLKGMLSREFVNSTEPGYQELPFSVTGRIDSPKTDLLDKLIGVKIGQDVGGLLKNLFRGAPSPAPKNQPSPAN